MQTIALGNGQLQVHILPQAGAGLARFDYIGQGAPLPLLRPYVPSGGSSEPPRANQLACFVLVPWSNRMAGGFSFGGMHHPIAPNRAGDPYPIHGEGWQFGWDVLEQSATHAVLGLARRGQPFSFDARICYALESNALDSNAAESNAPDEHALAVLLEVTNAGPHALPFGLGLHPYLPRTPGVTLQARAEQLWMPGPDKLPVHAEAVPPGWSFEQARSLPAEVIDHVFEDWDGRAEVAWPETGMRMAIESDARHYIVYTPANSEFFCFEPVDHLINAHNLPGGPQRNGLTVLAPGATLRRRFRFSVSALP